MWVRALLKQQAKNNLVGKYWTAFAVSLIAIVILFAQSTLVNVINLVAVFAASPVSLRTMDEVLAHFNSIYLISGIDSIVTYIISLIVVALTVEMVNIGVNRWYSRNRENLSKPQVGLIFSLFNRNDYGKSVVSVLWMSLFLSLWYLPYLVLQLFTQYNSQLSLYLQKLKTDGSTSIPAELIQTQIQQTYAVWSIVMILLSLGGLALMVFYTIKTVAYSMTPWILADNPQIGYRRALRLSIDMTQGEKGKIFVLDLSFIGWALLAILTVGIGLLFLAPYISATYAELYAVLRRNAVDKGLCTMDELGFVAVKAAE